MKVGIIRYPGSNCDFDTLRYFENSFFIWHDQTDVSILDDVDLIVIPGGFAFGDRVYVKATDEYVIDPGEMALNSPVTQIIFEAVKRKIIILGICNGFQILVKLKLLGGRLESNRTALFVCKKLSCIANYVENGEEKTYSEVIISEYILDNDTLFYAPYESSIMSNKKKIHLTEVTSPTFSLLNEYKIKNLTIHHFDLFRIKDANETENIGLFENYKDILTLIEWPEKIINKPKKIYEFYFNYNHSSEKRFISIYKNN